MSERRPRLRIGHIWIDAVTFPEALGRIEHLVVQGAGGSVYTPNVDHVVKAESNEAFRRAYDDVSLSLADGMPLVWVAGLLGCPLPERVAGSDLLLPLLKVAAKKGASAPFARSLLFEFNPAGDSRSIRSTQRGLIEPLTERELDVLRMLRSDLDGKEIARELGVSLNTMRTHTKSIYDKLGVNNRRAAVRRADELDLLPRGSPR